MYCICCGFSTNSGNKLAKHLGTHGCQSAYAYESPVAVKKARTTSSPEKEKTELCQLCGEQSVAYRSLKANTLKVEQVRDLLDLDLQANKEAGLASVICNKCCNFLDNWTNGQLENFLSFKRSVIKGQEIIKKKEEADKQRMTVDNR